MRLVISSKISPYAIVKNAYENKFFERGRSRYWTADSSKATSDLLWGYNYLSDPERVLERKLCAKRIHGKLRRLFRGRVSAKFNFNESIFFNGDLTAGGLTLTWRR